MRLVPYLFTLSLGSLLACSSTPATTTVIARPELIAVSPEDFLGTQQCGDGAGLVGSYVATLSDVTTASDGGAEPETGFPLPSSPPTRCAFPVTFSLVVAGHRYRAQVDAYDRMPRMGDGDLDPTHIQAVSLGGRIQQDGTGAHIAPRWTAICGGYPPTDPDAGLDSGTNSDDAGDALPPGTVSYDTLTRTVHDCQKGLQPVN